MKEETWSDCRIEDGYAVYGGTSFEDRIAQSRSEPYTTSYGREGEFLVLGFRYCEAG